MKILITGNLGFVGTETTKLLKESGHEVIGYDLMDSLDIRDKEQFERYLTSLHPDRVLHLAAIARFADADKDPKLAYETNVLGTKNVVEVCEKYHIPLVYSSTGSAVMPLDKYEPPYKETVPACGNSIYGCSKATGEYYVAKHTPHIILRYSHLYGADKVRHGLIGGFIDRIQRGLEPKLYGGAQTNDFLYIEDVAMANMLALTAQWSSWNEIYNIGSGHELSAKEAGDAVCRAFGWDGKIETLTQRTVDPNRFCFDITKAKTMLKFEPKFSFIDGLEKMKKEMYNKSNEFKAILQDILPEKQGEDRKEEKNLAGEKPR